MTCASTRGALTATIPHTESPLPRGAYTLDSRAGRTAADYPKLTARTVATACACGMTPTSP